MKAIVMRRFGGPEVLAWEDIPIPEPGPGEVLVKVRAVSVNRTLDLDLRAGLGNYGTILPHVLGVDPSGEVVELGSGVSRLQVGQRVVAYGSVRCGRCEHCSRNDYPQCIQPRMLGVQSWGGYAEYLCLPAYNWVSIPDALLFPEATLVARHFPLAFGEVQLSGLKGGEWALVMGAAGGLGSCIVQVLKTMKVRVIAAAGSDDRVETALSLGADCGVNYRNQDLEREVDGYTDGSGVAAVFENVGDPTMWGSAFNSMARGGRLVTVGSHGGGMVTLDLRRLYQNRLQVMSGLGAERMEDLEHSLQMAAQGDLRLLIDRVMPLHEAVEAHRLVEKNESVGKVVLDPTLE
ncbi:MAG: zinc-binding dehydrogenase [Chloroflexota bacterium]|nr:zinc-binding dehydrogenase [Chloroflexota bacterium]